VSRKEENKKKKSTFVIREGTEQRHKENVKEKYAEK
jgi:hypothetical protein